MSKNLSISDKLPGDILPVSIEANLVRQEKTTDLEKILANAVKLVPIAEFFNHSIPLS